MSFSAQIQWKNLVTRNTPDALYYADNCNPLTDTIIRLFYDKGVSCIRYNANQDGTTQISKVTDKPLIMIKPPFFVRGGKRILVATHYAVPELASANGVWDDVFTNRNVLHAASKSIRRNRTGKNRYRNWPKHNPS